MQGKYVLAAAVSLALMSGSAWAAPKIGEPAPGFSTRDISGKEQSLAAYKGKVVVLEWNNPGCPFVKKFYDSGRMQQFQADAKAKDVVWMTVNSGAAGKQGFMTQEEAKAQLATWKAEPSAYILDTDGKLGKLYEAKTTPHMYVIDKTGTLVYMGAIDDKPSTDAKDIPGAKNYVVGALDALAAGKSVEPPSTTAYGCNVKYAD